MENAHIQWAHDVLKKHNYQIQSEIPDIVQENPWSIVYRFKTNQGFLFLKKVPSALLLESGVITLLRTEFHANVPIIIANNLEQQCFLMKDAGIQLHHYYKKGFNINILIQTMLSYTNLQISATNKTQHFFDLGVPDWKMVNLPKLYNDLINQESLLIEDGLNKADLVKLKNLESKLSSLCEQSKNC